MLLLKWLALACALFNSSWYTDAETAFHYRQAVDIDKQKHLKAIIYSSHVTAGVFTYQRRAMPDTDFSISCFILVRHFR